jgi:hypothetical protein
MPVPSSDLGRQRSAATRRTQRIAELIRTAPPLTAAQVETLRDVLDAAPRDTGDVLPRFIASTGGAR